jgi:hypothetical protein
MPVLKCGPFDPFLLIKIRLTVAELQYVRNSFSVVAVELERASVFLPLYRRLIHSPPQHQLLSTAPGGAAFPFIQLSPVSETAKLPLDGGKGLDFIAFSRKLPAT